jgi:hypothetical protein
MTSTSKTGSKPSSNTEKPNETDKKKDKDKDKDNTDQDNLDQAISLYSIQTLQMIINGAKQRRADMLEDDPDAF